LLYESKEREKKAKTGDYANSVSGKKKALKEEA